MEARMRIPNPSSDLPKRMCDGVEGRGGGNGKSIMHIIIYYLVLCTYGIVDSWLRRRDPGGRLNNNNNIRATNLNYEYSCTRLWIVL